MRTYIAIATDKETKERKTFTMEYATKKDFASDLRGNGLAVNFIFTEEQYDLYMNDQDFMDDMEEKRELRNTKARIRAQIKRERIKEEEARKAEIKAIREAAAAEEVSVVVEEAVVVTEEVATVENTKVLFNQKVYVKVLSDSKGYEHIYTNGYVVRHNMIFICDLKATEKSKMIRVYKVEEVKFIMTLNDGITIFEEGRILECKVEGSKAVPGKVFGIAEDIKENKKTFIENIDYRPVIMYNKIIPSDVHDTSKHRNTWKPRNTYISKT